MDVNRNRQELISAMERAKNDEFAFDIRNVCSCIFVVAVDYDADMTFPTSWEEERWSTALGLPLTEINDLFHVAPLYYSGDHLRYTDIGYHTQRLRDAFAAHPNGRIERENTSSVEC